MFKVLKEPRERWHAQWWKLYILKLCRSSFNLGFLALEGPVWFGFCTSLGFYSWYSLPHYLASSTIGLLPGPWTHHGHSCFGSLCTPTLPVVGMLFLQIFTSLELPLSNQWAVLSSLSELSEYSVLFPFESSYPLTS